jgi:hypothetical protein
MTQYIVTLTYADSSTFIVGAFPSNAAAQAWIDAEKARPYWISSTTATIKTVSL